jgi:hypothetical protein
MRQNTLRLAVPRFPGESLRSHHLTEKLFNGEPVRHVPPEKLIADLLKRHARRIMSDISECPPDTIPAHLARLDDWREIVNFHLRHDLRETAESRLSGGQLVCPATLADWLAAAEITRRQHRAPAFVNGRDEMLEKIFAGIDQLAGLIAKDGELVNFLSSAERGGI